MIIKKVGIKGGWSGLKNTIRYLTSEHEEERVLEVGYRNIGIETPDLVWHQMRAIYVKNRHYWERERDISFGHYVIAFDKKREDLEKTRAVLDEFRETIGYGKCQCFYVIHGNTENQHIHTIINRWDVEKEELIPLNSIKLEVCKLQEIAAVLSDKYQIGVGIPRMYEKDEKGNYQSIYRTGKTRQEYRQQEKERWNREVEWVKTVLKSGQSWDEIVDRLWERGWSYYKSERNAGAWYLVNRGRRLWFADADLEPELQYNRIVTKLGEPGDAVEKYNEVMNTELKTEKGGANSAKKSTKKLTKGGRESSLERE